MRCRIPLAGCIAERDPARAEQILLDVQDWLSQNTRGPLTPTHHKLAARFVRLYDRLHATDPDKGYDAKAAEWRAKLPPHELAELDAKPAAAAPSPPAETEPKAGTD